MTSSLVWVNELLIISNYQAKSINSNFKCLIRCPLLHSKKIGAILATYMEHKGKEKTIKIFVFNIKEREHLRDLLKYCNNQEILDLRRGVDSG
jgi:hypothetical protein